MTVQPLNSLHFCYWQRTDQHVYATHTITPKKQKCHSVKVHENQTLWRCIWLFQHKYINQMITEQSQHICNSVANDAYKRLLTVIQTYIRGQCRFKYTIHCSLFNQPAAAATLWGPHPVVWPSAFHPDAPLLWWMASYLTACMTGRCQKVHCLQPNNIKCTYFNGCDGHSVVEYWTYIKWTERSHIPSPGPVPISQSSWKIHPLIHWKTVSPLNNVLVQTLTKICLDNNGAVRDVQNLTTKDIINPPCLLNKKHHLVYNLLL